MKIKDVKISGIGGISEVFLRFNPNMNIICGSNGVGKTTVLESLGHLFIEGATRVLKRNVNFERGTITSNINVDGVDKVIGVTTNVFNANESSHISNRNSISSKKIISLKTTRTFNYSMLASVSKDPDITSYQLSEKINNGVLMNDMKSWFVNRYLYSAHEGAVTKEQKENLELAKKSFSLMNENFSFSKVDASTNDVLVNTPSGEIYYEYLSSGFKSILSIITSIIKEIEFRFKDSKILAEDFDGVVLIDEIGLHLHPEWQEKIINVLMQVFPNVQFFVTTHSPHVIQTAKTNHVIAMGFDEKGGVIQRGLPDTEYGFQGWTIEEILTDIMGMESIRTKLFKSMIDEFGKAIDEEKYKDASIIYSDLDKMLHPENELRKILKLQLTSIKDD